MSAPDAEPAAASGKPDPDALSHMLQAVEQAAADGECRLGELIDAAGPHGAVPIMTLVALVVVSPLSGIPFVSSVCGITIATCALQAAFGRRALWLPDVLRRRRVNPGRVVASLGRMNKVAAWLERIARPRLNALSGRPVSTVFLLLATTFGATMPFLELVPMSSSLLAFAITLIGLGLMLRDGVLLLASLVTPGIAAAIVWSVWSA